VDTWGEMASSSLASYIHVFKRVSDVSKTVELLCSSDALVLRGMVQESVQVKNKKVSREGKFLHQVVNLLGICLKQKYTQPDVDLKSYSKKERSFDYLKLPKAFSDEKHFKKAFCDCRFIISHP
jgi:hypothetical protein